MKTLRFLPLLFVCLSAFGQGTPRTYDTYAQLTNQPPVLSGGKGTVTLRGFYSVGDGGEGELYYATNRPAGQESLSLPTGAGYGYWVRILNGKRPRPEMFGARGDGVSDDYAAVTNALAYNGTLELLQGKRYLVTSTSFFNNKTNYDVKGNGAFMLVTNTTYALSFENMSASSLSFEALTATATLGTNAISVAGTNNYSIGQYLQLRDSRWRGTNTSIGRNLELNRVRAIGPGVLYLDMGTVFDYLLSSNAEVAKIAPMNVNVDDVKVVSLSTNTGGGLKIFMATSGRINVSMYNGWQPGVHVYQSTMVDVVGGFFENSSPYGIAVGGTGYGVSWIDSSSRCQQYNTYSTRIREHSINAGCGYIKVHHNTMLNSYDDAVNTHGTGNFACEISDNDILYPRTLGINVSFSTAHREDRLTKVSRNRIWSLGRCILVESPITSGFTNYQVEVSGNWLAAGNGAAVAITTPNNGVLVANNHFVAPYPLWVSAYGVQVTQGRATVTGNRFADHYVYPILLQSGSSNCVITYNTFEDTSGVLTTPYIYVDGRGHTVRGNTFWGGNQTGVLLYYQGSNNIVELNEFAFFTDPTKPCISAEGTDNKLLFNHFHDNVNMAIDTTANSTRLDINGVYAERMRTNVVRLTGGGHTLEDLRVDSSSYYALVLSSLTNANIEGYRFRGVTNGLLLQNSSNVRLAKGDIVMVNSDSNQVAVDISSSSNVVVAGLKIDGSQVPTSTNTSLIGFRATTCQDLSIDQLNIFPVGWLKYGGVLATCERVNWTRSTIKDAVTNVGPVRLVSLNSGNRLVMINGLTLANSGQAYGLRSDGNNTNVVIMNGLFQNLASTDISSAGNIYNWVLKDNMFPDSVNEAAAFGFNTNSTWTASGNIYNGTLGPLVLMETTPPTFVPTNRIAIYPITTSYGTEVWVMRHGGLTNRLLPTTTIVDGVGITNAYFGDTQYTDATAAGSLVTINLVIAEVAKYLATNLLVAGANVTVTPAGAQVTVASTGGGGATNGTPLQVNGGGTLAAANIRNTSKVSASVVSATNIDFTIVADSLGTADLSAATETFFLSRANHTGSQAWSTITSTPTTLAGYGITDAQPTNGTLTRLGGIGPGTSGDILYRDATGWTNKAKGADGKVLKLVSGFPSWEDDLIGAGSSGTTVTVDSGSALTQLNIFDATGVLANISALTNLSFSLADRNWGDITTSGGGLTMTINANSVAMGTDTTGDFVGGVLGTANKVTVTGSGGENSTVTITLADVLDIGSHTSFEVPNGSAPVTDVVGELAADNNAWGASRGTLQTYDGTATTYLVNVQSTSTPADGQVPKFNNATKTITWQNDNTSGSAYHVHSATEVVNTGGDGTKVHMTQTIPAGTLSQDGDELLFEIFGTYSSYPGHTTQYFTWSFVFDSNPTTLASHTSTTSLPATSSARGVMWVVRVKRLSSDTFMAWTQFVIGHGSGDDFDESPIDQLRASPLVTIGSPTTFSDALDFTLSCVHDGSSGTSEVLRTYGYTIRRIRQ